MTKNNHISSIGKIEDAGSIVQGGGVDRYWERSDIELYTDYYIGTSRIQKAPYLHDSSKALQFFNLKSIEFGNWMNQEDRANFLYASMLGLHHLAIVLEVEDKLIGLGGKLSVALGARGRGGAAKAHYEPNPRSVINLSKTKGKGSLAHEFAHALDNVISYYSGRKQQSYVSGGVSTRKGYVDFMAKSGNYFEQQFEEFFNILYYDEDGNKTTFHEALDKATDYYNERTEVFARTFEVYIFELLKKKKIRNLFLVKGAYDSSVYPSATLVQQVTPIIKNIITKGFELMSRKGKDLKGYPVQAIGYKGFRKTLIENADLDDTLDNMQHIARRDTYQVKQIAHKLKGNNVEQTARNIWNWLRTTTRYKLDKKGLEELRTPARSIVDGSKGLNDPSYGIDCDDYTILISALLLNLDIDHEYRVVAYEEKGAFQHIYPVAIDEEGNEYVIDVVPEIPHFNYEAAPIKDIKIIKMTATELDGYPIKEPTINPSINPNHHGYKTENMDLHELSGIGDAQEFKKDLAEEINQPFNLSGIEDDLENEILADTFLSGLGEVANEEEADIVISSKEEALQLLENGLLAEVHKARKILEREIDSPTALSELINVPEELELMLEIIEAWEDEDEREATIKQAIVSGSSYANFFKALLISLSEMEEAEDLSGIGDEPIYLAKMEDVDLADLLATDNGLDGLGLFKIKKGFFKKIFKKVGTGIKKAVKTVVKYNPVTIATRAAILLTLKTNAFSIASSLIYGYLTKAQAEANGLDLTEWSKLVDSKNKGEGFFTKIGGKADKFRSAITKGKAAQKTGLRLSGLGETTEKSKGFVNFIKALLAKVNIKKLFKKKKKSSSDVANPNQPNMSAADFGANAISPVNVESGTAVSTNNPEDKPSIFKRVITKDFWKNEVWAKHKKKILVGAGFITIFIPLAVYFIQKWKQKRKRQLSGIKAAKTRARNRNKRSRTSSTSKRRKTTKKTTPTRRRKRKSTPKKSGTVGRGSTTVIQTPTKGKGKTRVKKMTSRERLSLMHKIAKDLQKKHPKTKYARLLSKAAKMI